MRELFVVAEESTEALWVLRTLDGERFCIPREDLIPPTFTNPAQPTHVTFSSELADRTGGADNVIELDRGFDGGFDSDGDDYEVVEAELVEEEDDEARDDREDREEEAAEPAEPAESLAPVRDDASARTQERTPAEPDPLFSTPLSLRPKEIQARIRAGASAEELAEEMGVALSRVEPYAHPVLLERAQVAEAAKQSHPVREDGPASDTLFEILALTFASRGHTLAEATWDAVREAGEPWIVRVTWQAGLQEHQAEWFFRRAMGSGATTEPRDPVAADLIDPSFAQPVRSLSAVGNPGYDLTQPTVDPADYAHEEDPVEQAPEQQQPQSQSQSQSPSQAQPEQTQPNLFAEGDFLEHPDPQDKPQKRRRKAVTPHWEDVLLGVRTNTKRPK